MLITYKIDPFFRLYSTRVNSAYERAYDARKTLGNLFLLWPCGPLPILGYKRGARTSDNRTAILEYARQHRMTVDDVVEVHGSTRRASQRAHVLDLIETLSPRDRLMVSELSRLGRSLGQILKGLTTWCTRESGSWPSRKRSAWRANRPCRRKAILTLFGLFAEIERDLIAERTKEGLIAAKAKGKRLGRPKGALGKSKLDGKEQEIHCSCASMSPKPPLHGSSRYRPLRSSTLSTRVSCRSAQARKGIVPLVLVYRWSGSL